MIAPDRRAFRYRRAISMICIALTTTPLISCAMRKPAVSEQAEQSESGAISAKAKNAEGCANPPVTHPATAEVLSNIKDVDFGPYLKRVVEETRVSWYLQIPDVAQQPRLKRGCVATQFRIMPDGSVTELKTVASSGDHSLDRAAQQGVLHAAPFPPLPKTFKGPYLALRFYFRYNEDAGQPNHQ